MESPCFSRPQSTASHLFARTRSFHRPTYKRPGTKSYNARAEPLFCSLNLLFSDVPVAVAVVVILNSLLIGSLSNNDDDAGYDAK